MFAVTNYEVMALLIPAWIALFVGVPLSMPDKVYWGYKIIVGVIAATAICFISLALIGRANQADYEHAHSWPQNVQSRPQRTGS
jgi:hypothetical protein